MEVPDGYFDYHDNSTPGKDMVLKLSKALYGLKQAPLKWKERFNKFIQGIVFKQSDADPCVYYLKSFINLWDAK